MSTLCMPWSFHIHLCIDTCFIVPKFVCAFILRDLLKCLCDKVSKYSSYILAKYHFYTDNIYNNVLFTVQKITLKTAFSSHAREIQFHTLIIWRHHIQVMSSNLAPGFDQRLIIVTLTTLDKGDFASLASMHSLNQPCIQHRLNTYTLHAQQAKPLAEFFIYHWK